MTMLLNRRHLGLVPLLTICAATCAYGQRWGNFKKDSCTKPGYRQYSAILWDVPLGASWEKACASQSAMVNGQNFSHPARCKNTGTNEWGEFDVPDDTCEAHWGNFQSVCLTNGKREYSAQLSVPEGLSWEATCAATPTTLAGQSFPAPTRCENRGITGEWGMFYVNDSACEVHPLPSQWPNPNPDPNKPIWGFADTHNHQFAYLGFGGKFVAGEVFDPGPDGIKTALQWCDCLGTHTLLGCPPEAPNQVHGPGGSGDHLGDGITHALGVRGTSDVGHKVGGYPQFDGWPVWNSVTHQQAYYQWLKRAHAGGLELMVMQAVNNEMLCAPMAATGHAPLGCNDMEAADRQLAQAKNLESYVTQHDGGWYKIVYSAEEARQAIHRGQLAVVLGIEVADLFNCARIPNPCTNDAQGRQYVQTQLRKYYDLGVRHLFPIHGTDDAFGGTGIFEYVYLLNNMYFNRGDFTVYDCSAQGVNFTLGATTSIEQPLIDLLHGLFPSQVPSFPGKGQCNAQGLTDLGKFLVQEMMNLHMIIEVDHMSWRGIDETLTMAEARHYPAVISSHSGYIETSTGTKMSEGQKNASQLHRIFSLGGMAGVITAQGVTASAGGAKPTDPGGISQWKRNIVADDCSNSSKTFAQAYLFAVDTMGGPSTARVALATDLMGGIYQPGPRFGDNACFSQNGDVRKTEISHQTIPHAQRVQYPFTLPGMTVPLYQSRACDGRDFNSATADCNRTFDFNVDGLAHVGMLPDLIQDLRQVGLTDNDLNPLLRSAEAYIQMWEKAEKLQ